MRRTIALGALGALGLLAALGCGHRDWIAQLDRASGQVERQETPEASWGVSRVSDHFELGSALRTADGAHATLSLRQGGRLEVKEHSIVRFSRRPGRPLGINVAAGEIEVEATEALAIDTELGTARVAAGGSARFTSDESGRSLQVLVGEVVLERDGKTRALAAGETIQVDIGNAELEPVKRAPPAVAPVSAPASAPASQPAAPAPTVTATVKGRRAQVQVQNASGWTALPPGESSIPVGAKLRIDAHTEVEIADGEDRAVITGEAEVVVRPDGGALVQATHGKIALVAHGQDVRVVVPGGVIVSRAAAKADLDVGAGRTKVNVRRGPIDVQVAGGDESLKAGESLDVLHDGRLELVEKAPTQVDVTISAGEVAVLHDARPPTAVRVTFADRCAGEATLEVERRPAAVMAVGTGGANVRLPAGSHAYKVRCTKDGEPGDVVARGEIRVLNDSGRAPLPKVPPTNVVDADGHSYEILYQNILPAFTFRWPKAPPADSYAFVLESKPGKELRASDAQPVHGMKSGSIAEGRYRWWFEAGAARSPVTSLVVSFDNAAPMAYIRKVAAGEGGALHVEGSVLEGSVVTSSGQPVSIDGSGRFSVDGRPDAESGTVAVRIAHPQHGIHYYITRPSHP